MGTLPWDVPRVGYFAATRVQLRLLCTKGEALRAPQRVSKSRIIRSNGQNVGKEWTYWTFLEWGWERRGSTWCRVRHQECPASAARGTPLSPPGTRMRGDSRLQVGAQGPPLPTVLSHQHCPSRSHSQIPIPAGSVPSLRPRWPRVAPLGVRRHPRNDDSSVQPCCYTALPGQPARPARLLGKGLRLLQLPNNGCWRGLSASLQGMGWFS